MERLIETPDCLVDRRRGTEELRSVWADFQKVLESNPDLGRVDYPLFVNERELAQLKEIFKPAS